MKKLLLGSVATGALVAAGSASAADLGPRPAYKAPPMVAPVPVFSWTGCFVGAHGGWGWGRKEVTQTVHSTSDGNGVHSGTADTSGAIFGGQIGCDYQFAGNWVLGIQGDLAGTRLTGDIPDPFEPTDQTDRLRFNTDWLASVTGRLGFSGLVPRTLVYVKGGVAWVRDIFDFRNADVGGGDLSVIGQTRTGWTIGGGIEYAIAPNWSVFAEFDHYDFGTRNVLSKSVVNPSNCGGPCVFSDTFSVKQRIEAVKLGVNYRFNWLLGKSPPVTARY